MNNQTRRHQQRRRAVDPAARKGEIPPWSTLAKLNAGEVEALAGQLGIPYTNRAKTLSAINQAR